MLKGFFMKASLARELWAEYEKFTVTVSRETYIPESCVVLFTEGAGIVALGRLKNGHGVATLDKVIAFERVTPVDSILDFDQIEERLAPRLRLYFRRAFINGGVIPSSTWDGIQDVIRRLSPDLYSCLMELAQDTRQLFRHGSWQTVAFEKDALNLSLRLANMPQDAIARWRVPRAPAPYLQGLDSVRVIEDRLIENDLRHLCDGWWTESDRGLLVTLTNGQRRLDVLNVNRDRIERTTGVDLIYYNHTFQSYVVVQYKRMTRSHSESRSIYRPTGDGSFDDEMERMVSLQPLEVAATLEPNALAVRDYRLNRGPCYLKFCEPELDLTAPQLSRGMYLPLDHFRHLLDSEKLRGERNGLVVSYDTVDRYMDNTQFTGLVTEGWIGSAGQVTEQITALISCLLSQNHSVTLARDTGAAVRYERHRRRHGRSEREPGSFGEGSGDGGVEYR